MIADSPPAPRWRKATGSVWFHLAAAFVVVGIILSLVAKPYIVPSGSMESTLEPGDRILVSRLAFVGSQPTSGDIVVFDADEAWNAPTGAPVADPLRVILRWLGEITGFGPSGDHTLVKRVIASPGQVVMCCSDAGAIMVDGAALDETYLNTNFPFEPGVLDCATQPRSLRCFAEVTVPDASYLMLGDHRSRSSDSASRCRGDSPGSDCWRWADQAHIVGKAVAILWPIQRWTGL